jgi:hypothetical protein
MVFMSEGAVPRNGVTQTHEGWPHGNCVQATYATLFDCPIECVPRFDPAAIGGSKQGDLERQWLASLGLDLVEIAVPSDGELPGEVLDVVAEEWPAPHLISGMSPRGFGHRCVGIGGRVAWDPHPSREGLVTVYSIGLLVPMIESW